MWDRRKHMAALLSGGLVFLGAVRPTAFTEKVPGFFAGRLPVDTHISPSCKPTPPLTVELAAAPGTDRWNLRLRTLDTDREVVVWMWSSLEASRRVVWQGHLTPGSEHGIEVLYAPSSDAARVWVAVEPAQVSEMILCSVAAAPIPGREPVAALREKGILFVEPETGQQTLQYTGQLGDLR